MTRLSLFVVAALLLRCGPARAYIDTSMTLGKIIKDSQRIFVIDFEKMNSERKAILFKKVTDLKGKTSEVDFRFHLADAYAPGAPGDVLASAEPKARAVCFVTGRNTLLYLGNTWHLCHRDQDSEWWTVLSARPELSLAYIGSAHRLARHVGDILAGKDAIVTTIVHGATARGSFADVVFNRTSRFDCSPVQRIRVSLKMPDEVYHIGADKRWFVGLGAADAGDIPQLTKELKDADPYVRRDAADLLGLLGTSAKEAVPQIRLLLKDEPVPVAAHAAAAILRIAGADDEAARMLLAMAQDKEKGIRSLAIRLLGGVRPSSPAMIQAIARQLHDPAEDVARAAIDALGRLGPDAQGAVVDLVKKLPNQELRGSVLAALGRIGPKARAAQPAIAELLAEKGIQERRRVAQTMALIGGPVAAKAIPVLVADLKGSEREAYNAIIYLGLLGEHGKDALPALRSAGPVGAGSAPMAIWAIEPTKQFPWQMGYTADRDCDLWFFATFVEFLGPRAAEAAKALVNAALDGRAGDRIPNYAMPLLEQQEMIVLSLLFEGTANSSTQVRRRAVALLGRMRSTDERVGTALQRLEQDVDVTVREAARDAAKRRGKEANQRVR